LLLLGLARVVIVSRGHEIILIITVIVIIIHLVFIALIVVPRVIIATFTFAVIIIKYL
jgi:hypothetical protein